MSTKLIQQPLWEYWNVNMATERTRAVYIDCHSARGFLTLNALFNSKTFGSNTSNICSTSENIVSSF